VALRHDGRARLKLLLLIFSLAVPLPGLSQPFPAKPVRIIVPFPPGGGADALARLMALLMSSTASLTQKNVAQFAPVTLVALARANPGKLTYASSGSGAASHLSAELFKSMAGVDLLHVPYKGALGADPRGNTPEEFARFIREDQAKWATLMREAGITPE
jgi:tripartite-type tricarboxylate transporter receptor subunit TctC